MGMSRASGQRTVSQMEARSDWLLSSLVRYLDAVGAEATMTISVNGREFHWQLADGQ